MTDMMFTIRTSHLRSAVPVAAEDMDKPKNAVQSSRKPRVPIITFVLFGEHMVGKQYIGMAVVILGALGILMQQKAMPADKNKI